MTNCQNLDTWSCCDSNASHRMLTSTCNSSFPPVFPLSSLRWIRLNKTITTSNIDDKSSTRPACCISCHWREREGYRGTTRLSMSMSTSSPLKKKTHHKNPKTLHLIPCFSPPKIHRHKEFQKESFSNLKNTKKILNWHKPPHINPFNYSNAEVSQGPLASDRGVPQFEF